MQHPKVYIISNIVVGKWEKVLEIVPDNGYSYIRCVHSTLYVIMYMYTLYSAHIPYVTDEHRIKGANINKIIIVSKSLALGIVLMVWPIYDTQKAAYALYTFKTK